MTTWNSRLAELGITLPALADPVAGYAPAVLSGDHVHTAGHLPLVDGVLPVTGKVGAGVGVEQAGDLARTCALNALAAVDAVVGIDAVVRVVRVVGYVASADGFTGQSAVLDGASELLGQVFGPVGVPARTAVGVAELPLGAPVEVELLVAVAPEHRRPGGRAVGRSVADGRSDLSRWLDAGRAAPARPEDDGASPTGPTMLARRGRRPALRSRPSRWVRAGSAVSVGVRSMDHARGGDRRLGDR